jgi:molybdopterin converting factor small subunit
MTEAPKKQVEIQYFAVLKEQSGIPGETIQTSAQTLRQLYVQLKEKHKFGLPLESLRVAVDDQFRSWDDLVEDRSKVVLIPPVAGG